MDISHNCSSTISGTPRSMLVLPRNQGTKSCQTLASHFYPISFCYHSIGVLLHHQSDLINYFRQNWCGYRESNPSHQLGKLRSYLQTIAAQVTRLMTIFLLSLWIGFVQYTVTFFKLLDLLDSFFSDSTYICFLHR